MEGAAGLACCARPPSACGWRSTPRAAAGKSMDACAALPAQVAVTGAGGRTGGLVVKQLVAAGADKFLPVPIVRGTTVRSRASGARARATLGRPGRVLDALLQRGPCVDGCMQQLGPVWAIDQSPGHPFWDPLSLPAITARPLPRPLATERQEGRVGQQPARGLGARAGHCGGGRGGGRHRPPR